MLGLTLFCASLATISWFEEPGVAPAVLLEDYLKINDQYGNISFSVTCSSKVFSSIPGVPNNVVTSEKTCKVTRKQDAWKLVINRRNRNLLTKMEWQSDSIEMMYNGKTANMIPFKNRTATGFVTWLDSCPEGYGDGINSSGTAIFINGVGISSSIPLAQVFHESKMSSRTDKINGIVCNVLECDGPWGHFELWLDQQTKHLPRRVVESKQGQDWMAKNKVFLEVAKTSYHPSKKATSCKHTTDIVDTQLIQGIPIVKNFVVSQDWVFEDKNTLKIMTTYKMENVDFSSQSTASILVPDTKIPNGLEISVQDRPNLEHEWRDGRVVQRISTLAEGRLNQAEFRPAGFWSKWRAWIVASSIGAVIILGFGAWKLRGRKQGAIS